MPKTKFTKDKVTKDEIFKIPKTNIPKMVFTEEDEKPKDKTK